MNLASILCPKSLIVIYHANFIVIKFNGYYCPHIARLKSVPIQKSMCLLRDWIDHKCARYIKTKNAAPVKGMSLRIWIPPPQSFLCFHGRAHPWSINPLIVTPTPIELALILYWHWSVITTLFTIGYCHIKFPQCITIELKVLKLRGQIGHPRFKSTWLSRTESPPWAQ